MSRAPQKRRLETRAKLLEVAGEIVSEQGYSGLRVEDVVARAGVAKGTLFSHFGDKDGMLAVLIGTEVMGQLDQIQGLGMPESIEDLTDRLNVHIDFVAQDRMIFDILLRYSGAIGAQTDEVIAQSFIRRCELGKIWLSQMQAAGLVRKGLEPELLAEGLEAFLAHVLAISFCMEHDLRDPKAALKPFLQAWLSP